MPRYLVERSFPADPGSPAAGARTPDEMGADALRGVTWIRSYVSPDRRRSWCICDGPSPEAIRWAAQDNGLPVDRITEVRVLDPPSGP